MGLAVLAVAAALAPGFHARVQPIPPAMRAQMTGVSWHPGCPVPLSGLRLITLTYRGFDGRDHTGRLVANRDAAGALVVVFRRLYAARFPIRRMGWSTATAATTTARSRPTTPRRSTAAPRPARRTGRSTPTAGRSTSTRSRTRTSAAGRPRIAASRPYLDRSRHRPGMAYEGGRARRGVPLGRVGLGRQLERTRQGLPALLASDGSVARLATCCAGPSPPRVTPLRDGGDALDEDAFGPVVDFLAARRARRAARAGDERRGDPALRAERKRAAELFVEASAGRLQVAVHCGAQTTATRSRSPRTRPRRGRRGRGDRAAVLPARRRAPCSRTSPRRRPPARRSPFYVYEFERDERLRRAALAVLDRLREAAPNLAGLKVSDIPGSGSRRT